MNIQLTIPDAVSGRVVNAVAAMNNYQPVVPNGSGAMVANPETKAQFAKRMISEKIIQMVKQYETQQAAQAAMAQAASSVDTDIKIT